LWYGLDFGAALHATPIPREVTQSLEAVAPWWLKKCAMRRLGRTAMLPESPDRRPSLSRRAARRTLFLRYLALRFPARLLVLHGFSKAVRRLKRRAPEQPE
jgi:hypothetical protein